MDEKVDRRGFMRLLRRSQDTPDAPEPEAERELTLRERQIQEMAEFSARLLADVTAEDEEPLADGPVLTKAHDQAYMRVTAGHIVYSNVIGSSAIIKTSDVSAFDTEPPLESEGYGDLVAGVVRAHHPADPPTITRSYAFRFAVDSPLTAAIRTACNIPEPEPEEEPEPDAEPEPDNDSG